MAVQTSLNNLNQPFLRYQEPAYMKTDGTFEQDAGRSAVLAPFTVLGLKAVSVPTTGTADVGNTGDGTVTAVSANGDQALVVGTYTIECVVAATNGGTFKLTDPNSVDVVGDLVMTAGAGAATVFSAGGLTFTITDGAADFIVGDKFTVAVTAVNKYVPLDKTAHNGADKVAGIYMGDEVAAATIVAGDVSNIPVLVGGAGFDKDQLVLESSLALTTVLPSGKTVEQELADIGLFAVDTVDITGYENA